MDVRVTVFTWEASGVWSSEMNLVRGNTISRGCDEEKLTKMDNIFERE